MQDQAMNEKNAAAYIGCAAGTLRRRSEGRGPTFDDAGRLIRYRKSELDKWSEKQSREPRGNFTFQQLQASLPINHLVKLHSLQNPFRESSHFRFHLWRAPWYLR